MYCICILYYIYIHKLHTKIILCSKLRIKNDIIYISDIREKLCKKRRRPPIARGVSRSCRSCEPQWTCIKFMARLCGTVRFSAHSHSRARLWFMSLVKQSVREPYRRKGRKKGRNYFVFSSPREISAFLGQFILSQIASINRQYEK